MAERTPYARLQSQIRWDSQDEKFCGICGAPAIANRNCANGHRMETGEKFCGACGAKPAATPVVQQSSPAPAVPADKSRFDGGYLASVIFISLLGVSLFVIGYQGSHILPAIGGCVLLLFVILSFFQRLGG